MSGIEPARPARRTIFGVLAVIGATLVIASCQQAGSSSASPSFSPASRLDAPRDAPRRAPRRASTTKASARRVTVFDDGVPAVANLDPDLLCALRQAATDAAEDGVQIFVNSGWRSPEYQAQLLRQAVSKYGSKAAAARWVATVDTSPHVSGDAVDIWPSRATAWLSRHGAAYGLCQIYRNERWHYELRPKAVVRGCPSMYADPTRDPRMQK